MSFNIVYSLQIDTVEITSLAIAFECEKTKDKTPNTANISVYNASSKTVSIMERIGASVILKAGYSDTGIGNIFAGKVKSAFTEKEGASWITRLELVDGLLEFRDKKSSFSLGSDASTKNVAEQCAKDFGIPLRFIPEEHRERYKDGFAFAGKTRDAMDTVCEFEGWAWSIQDEELQITKKGKALEERAYVISAATGMIGSPSRALISETDSKSSYIGITETTDGLPSSIESEEQKILQQSGWDVKMLLNPFIKVDGYVQLDDKGFYRVEQVRHSGHSHGNEWITSASLRSIS